MAKTLTQRIALDGGKEIKAELEALGAVGKKAFRDLEQAAGDLKGPTPAFIKGLRDAQRQLKTISDDLNRLGQSVQRAGQSLTTFVTLPLVGLGAASVQAFGEFEAAISNVSTLVDTSTESIEEMGEAVLDIGSRTPVALGELSAALYDIRSAGIAAVDAMDVLENSARLAVAGLGTTKEAADIATSSINAFGLSGEQQARVYDLIFRTVKAGKTTLSELAQGFGAVAGVVANAKIELDEYLASVAALTTTGLPAAQAHSQIRAAIVGLTRDSKELRVVLDQLGAKNFADLVQRSGGMVAAFQRISKAVGGDAAALIKLTGSAEGYNAVIALTGKQNAAFVGTLDGMRSGLDALDEAFDKQAATVNATFTVLRNQLAAAAISFGEELVPKVKEFVKFIGEMVDSFRNLDPRMRDFIVNAGLIAAALGPALIVIGALIRSVGTLALALRGLIGLLAFGGGAGLAITALVGVVGTGIAAWALAAGDANAAMEAHQRIVGQVKDAYDAAGRSVAAMTQEVKDRLLLETTAAAQETERALRAAMESLRRDLEVIRNDVDFGPLVDQFLDGTLSIEKFTAAVARIGASNPELAESARQLLEVTAGTEALSSTAAESADFILLLTGKMSDAEFRAKHMGEAIAAAVGETGKLGDEVTDTAAKVEDLGETIKVTRFGGAGGPVQETFRLVDGIATAVDASKQGLDDLTGSAADAAGKVEQVFGAVRTVPDALKGQASPAEALTEGLDQAETAFRDTGAAATDAGVVAEGGAAAAGAAWQQAGENAKAALDALPAAAQVATDGVLQEIARIDVAMSTLGASSEEGEAGAGLVAALGQMQEAAAAAAEGLMAPFRETEAAITAIWDGITALTQTGFDGLLSSADAAVAGIGRVAQQIASKLRSELDALIATLNAAMQRIIASIDKAIARLKRAAAQAKSSGGSSGGDKGLAHGGLILGAGTATSDSIPIWASNNEFMMQARAVRKYGVAFMRMINSGRLSLKALKGMMPGFAQGGLIGGVDLSGLDLNGLLEGLAGALGGNVLQPRLAIAGGGAIAPQRSLRPINLTLPGGETFALLADETVAEKVMRFAVGSELRTAGRKPGWAR